jgi:hypothetical protein
MVLSSLEKERDYIGLVLAIELSYKSAKGVKGAAPIIACMTLFGSEVVLVGIDRQP